MLKLYTGTAASGLPQLRTQNKPPIGDPPMEEIRKNPDQPFRAGPKKDSGKTQGKLKLFFGYAAGVGKTCAMLEAAHRAKECGADVVAGFVDPHAWPETAALLQGLEQLPAREIRQGGRLLREFDPDAALRRKPQMILVDDLAHVNGAGSRHARRYQDVQELLRAGIDVCATVSVEHIESLSDTVASITGSAAAERIPDSVFDQADQVELVDIEPEELLIRLAGRSAFPGEQAGETQAPFLTEENLAALRDVLP